MTEKIIIRQADFILTMDDKRNEFRNQDIRIANGEITEIGKNLLLADETREINARGCVVTPGLVNTHHHLFQTLTKAVPEGQDALLFGWLKTLYPIWSKFGPEEIRVSAMTGLAELALSGCSLTSDHLYLYPNGSRLDDTIDAAKEIGRIIKPDKEIAIKSPLKSRSGDTISNPTMPYPIELIPVTVIAGMSGLLLRNTRLNPNVAAAPTPHIVPIKTLP